jgi:hypothetical protein
MVLADPRKDPGKLLRAHRVVRAFTCWSAALGSAPAREGLLRDETRPPGKKPLSAAVKRKVLSKTASELPPNATHWSRSSMAAETGIPQSLLLRARCSLSALLPGRGRS